MCITHTVEHNYISPSSRLGIQLHVSAPVCGLSSGCDLSYRAAISDVWGVLIRVFGFGWGKRDLVVSIVGTMT